MKSFVLICLSLVFLCGCNQYENTIDRGLIKLNLGYYKSAIHDFDNCIKKKPNPQSGYLFLLRGIAHYYLDDTELASRDFNRAVQIGSNLSNVSGASHYYLGWLSYAEGDYESAFQYFSSAWSINEGGSRGSSEDEHPEQNMVSNASVFYARGMSSYKQHISDSTRRDYFLDIANQDFLQAVKSNKYYAYGFYGMGLVSLAKSDFAVAVSNFDMAVILDNKFGKAYYFRGMAKIKDNRGAKGYEDIRWALKYKADVNDSLKLFEKIR